MKTLSFTFNGNIIEYAVDYRKRKSIGISISAERGLQVYAPRWVSDDQLQEVLLRKAPWILKNQASIRERSSRKSQKEFIAGEIFLYQGDNYTLYLSEHSKDHIIIRLEKDSKRFVVTIPADIPPEQRREILKQAMIKWYKQQAKLMIDERIKFYSDIMQLYPAKVLIKDHKRIWGSCTGKNTININWKIIMAPLPIVDYLIVHELAHIKEKNHSSRFWDLAASILPDCKERSKWLKTNGFMLHI